MREALLAAEAKAAAAEDRRTRDLARADKEFQDFLAQCEMIDSQRGYRINICVEAIEHQHQREMELRTALMSGRRDDMYYSLRVDPFFDLRRDRDNFVRVVGAKVAHGFANALERRG